MARSIFTRGVFRGIVVRFRAPVLLLLGAALAAGPAAAGIESGSWADGFHLPGLGGSVNALAWYDGKVVVGGVIHSAGPMVVSNIVAWDGASWTALAAGLNGEVCALAVHAGSLYAGGAFTSSDGAPMPYLARWDGSAWHAVPGTLNGVVRALAIYSGSLAVGGDFYLMNGNPAARIVLTDGAGTWTVLGTGLNGPVASLAVSGTELYAGGDFTASGATAVSRVARWDGTWHALGSGLDAQVRALAFWDGYLYAGGSFLHSGSAGVQFLGVFLVYNWASVPGGVSGPVCALCPSSEGLWVGGSFAHAGGGTGPCVGLWKSGWMPCGLGLSATCSALLNAAGTIYAGGRFDGSGQKYCGRIARWSAPDWQPVGLSAGWGIDGLVGSMASYQGSIVISCSYFAGTVPTRFVARWNGAGWQAIGSNLNWVENGLVEDLFVWKDELYAAGGFAVVGSGPVTYGIARWDGSVWQPVGDLGFKAQVYDLTEWRGLLIAVGNFAVNGVQYMAAWDGASWQALGGSPDGQPEAAGVYRGDLIVGGLFEHIGGCAAARIARFDGTAWHPLGSGLAHSWKSGSRDGAEVQDLVVHDGDLIVGGWIESAGGVPVRNIARWDGTTWSALGAGLGVERVYALESTGTDLLAGGWFDSSEGPIACLARWDGDAWTEFSGGCSSVVYSLLWDGSVLWAGGAFRSAGGMLSQSVAAWQPDPTGVTSLRPGIGSMLSARPNPFTDRVRIERSRSNRALEPLLVLDAAGRVAAILRAPEPSEFLEWDGRLGSGAPAPAGVYWIRPEGAVGEESCRVLRVR